MTHVRRVAVAVAALAAAVAFLAPAVQSNTAEHTRADSAWDATRVTSMAPVATPQDSAWDSIPIVQAHLNNDSAWD